MTNFPLGQIVTTPRFTKLADICFETLVPELLQKHSIRVLELDDGMQVFSSFKLHGGEVWVITEPDRSVTTLLVPDEY